MKVPIIVEDGRIHKMGGLEAYGPEPFKVIRARVFV
jgi:hypothetical protein